MTITNTSIQRSIILTEYIIFDEQVRRERLALFRFPAYLALSIHAAIRKCRRPRRISYMPQDSAFRAWSGSCLWSFPSWWMTCPHCREWCRNPCDPGRSQTKRETKFQALIPDLIHKACPIPWWADPTLLSEYPLCANNSDRKKRARSRPCL